MGLDTAFISEPKTDVKNIPLFFLFFFFVHPARIYDLNLKCFHTDIRNVGLKQMLGAKIIVLIFGQNSISLKRAKSTEYWVEIYSELLIDLKSNSKLVSKIFRKK